MLRRGRKKEKEIKKKYSKKFGLSSYHGHAMATEAALKPLIMEIM